MFGNFFDAGETCENIKPYKTKQTIQNSENF